MTNKYDKLSEVFRKAKEAAIAADPGNEGDGGTCNFDSPAFRIHRGNLKKIEAAAEAAEVSVYRFDWFGRKWFWLNECTNGQGNRRTTMAEAATKVLKEAVEAGTVEGLEATTYYQMD